MTPPEIAVSRPVPLVLTLFGPMQVFVEGRPLPPIRSRKALSLLALLTLRPQKAVEREWLAGTLWPDADQEQSFANLRPVLSELRRALSEQGYRLQSPNRHTLFFDLDGAHADVLAFDSAMAEGTLSSLEQAIRLYQGPLLEGSAEEWVGQERAVREQGCLRALTTMAESALTDGNFSLAAAYCRRAVSLDPWRDGAYRILMEALSRGGDTNAALQTYREFVELLRSDPKAAPDARTTALYTRLRSESRRQATGPASSPSATFVPVLSGYLPHALTDLVGREDERAEVISRLRRSRLVTLTGPGGIGKTRLALSVASEVVSEYADGVWMVALEALSDERMVAEQVAVVLGLRQVRGRTALQSLAHSLRGKRLMLVLDNCEHLLDACAQAAGYLLRECAGLRVLATSREALGITGESAWGVPALAVPDPAHLPIGRSTLLRVLLGYESVQLFVERAQAAQKSFALTEDTALPVAHICARLVGLPLAIELAAARVKVLTAAQIAARLDDYLGLLTGGSRASQLRQQTLRATLDWSYDLLSLSERVLLERLSVFAGGWSLEAAEHICAGDGVDAENMLDLLTALVDKSLVAFAGDRYRLLEMVRQYGAERLKICDEMASVQVCHRKYFITLAKEAEPHLIGARQAEWLARLETEHDNLRTALVSCNMPLDGAEAGLQLSASLWRFWELRGHYSEGQAYLSEALTREGADRRTKIRAQVLNAAGVLDFYQGDYPSARARHEESLAISRELEDKQGIAWSLNDLGKVAFGQGDYETARALHEESLTIFRSLGHKRGIGWSIHQLGSMIREQGDYMAAQTLYEESLAISRELGDQQGIAWSLNDLGGIAGIQGDYPSAQTLYEESLAISRELEDKQGIAWSLHHLGNVALDQADLETAHLLHEEGLAIFRTLGNRQAIAWTLHQLGNVAVLQNDYSAANSLQQENLAIQRELKNKLGVSRALNSLGHAALKQQHPAAAGTHYAEAIDLQKELKDKRGVAESLRGLAAVFALQSASSKAVRLWGAAEAVSESIGTPIAIQEHGDCEGWLGQVRAALGPEAFAAAWESGRALTWDQAAEYALEEAAQTIDS